MFECCHTETDYRSGRRYIPVRRTDGELWLHTEYVADSAADAMAAALHTNRDLHPDWVAENELVGIAEVYLDIRNLLTTPEMPAQRR